MKARVMAKGRSTTLANCDEDSDEGEDDNSHDSRILVYWKMTNEVFR